MTKRCNYQLVEDLDRQILSIDPAKRYDSQLGGIPYELGLSPACSAELRAGLELCRKDGRIVRKSTLHGAWQGHVHHATWPSSDSRAKANGFTITDRCRTPTCVLAD